MISGTTSLSRPTTDHRTVLVIAVRPARAAGRMISGPARVLPAHPDTHGSLLIFEMAPHGAATGEGVTIGHPDLRPTAW